MSDNSTMFENYLTEHLGKVSDSSTRAKKKQWLKYNYYTILSSLSKDQKILEVGPGLGELLEFLLYDMEFLNVTAVDISKEVVELCNKISPACAVLIDENLSYFNDKEEEFDCILMLHVLEHVPKDKILSLLNSLYRSLKKGGFIVVEVPNMANPLVGLNFRYADFTHEIGFTEPSLRYVLSKAGFLDIQVSSPKVPAYSINRKIQYLLQATLNLFISLLIKVYIPTSKQIVATAIFAVAGK